MVAHTLRAAVTFALASFLACCAPQGDAECDGLRDAAILSSAEIIATANVLRDAQERIMPQLADSRAARTLRAELDAVTHVLAATEAAALTEAATKATRALAALPHDSSLAGDLHAVHLVLAHIHELAASRRTSSAVGC